MDNVPESVTYVVIGAGIHGLSSAWHPAMELEARGRGSGRDIVVQDKSGAGAFTPDNVPIFDWVAPNVYMIADSNHGFKMTGVGKLLARQLMGDSVSELKPFAFSRYAEGRIFGASNSHSPWV